VNQPPSIPESHRDLLDGPVDVALVTVMPDGQPQATVVWCNLEGPYVMVNTIKGFRKERNMRARPQVALLAIDPADPLRWIEVRGTVELIDKGAEAHLDRLAALYAGSEHYFGGVVPAEYAQSEVPVIARITPVRVQAEAFR
jgi:PPOX class probable F420-dependent enzyme